MLYRLNLGSPMTPYYHLFTSAIWSGRTYIQDFVYLLYNFDSGHKLPSSLAAHSFKKCFCPDDFDVDFDSIQITSYFCMVTSFSPPFVHFYSPCPISHYCSRLLFRLPHLFLLPPAPPALDLMDPPPTGLLAGFTAPPPREAVFNPYLLPVSPPPGNVRPQPHRQPELLWLRWMVCLAAWTTEALCAHPMMSQEVQVPPDEHFETISARNIYIQTRRAVHEFNIQQLRIARGVSLLQHVVPSPEATTTFGQYRVNPNSFIRALGTPEDNLALGTAADEALLSRLQSHRNYDSNSRHSGYTAT